MYIVDTRSDEPDKMREACLNISALADTENVKRIAPQLPIKTGSLKHFRAENLTMSPQQYFINFQKDRKIR